MEPYACASAWWESAHPTILGQVIAMPWAAKSVCEVVEGFHGPGSSWSYRTKVGVSTWLLSQGELGNSLRGEKHNPS